MDVPMRIVLIGAGNLATNLGKALVRVGHEVVQVYSRTETSASALASVLNCTFTVQLADVVKSADIFIISVKDSVLPLVAEELKTGREGQLFVHTAGSMPLSALPFHHRGVFYPMQTFSKNREVNFRKIPCFVEAEDENDLKRMKLMATDIADSVYELSSENRQYLHLAAVFCCNFANHCFALGAQLLQQHGCIPFSVMLPLIDETATKLHQLSPREAQTGPAVRWDTNVIDKQRKLLTDMPDVQQIYDLLSLGIHHDSL